MKKILISLAITLTLAMGVVLAGSDNLCYKSSGTGWSCGINPDPNYVSATGSVEWTDVSGQIEITVELSGMKPDFEYQFTLNGRNGGDGNVALGSNCPKPNSPATWYDYSVAWECGFWSGNEGFWNFEMDALTDSTGYYKHTYYLALPIGHYGKAGASCTPLPNCNYPLGFIVKEAGDSPSSWSPVLMEESGVEFTIVGRSFEKEKIWDKLHSVQNEIADLQNQINDLKIYIEGKLSEIWNKLYLVQDEISAILTRLTKIESCPELEECMKEECPYECCLPNEYKPKSCPIGEECISHFCIAKENCNLNDDKSCDGSDLVTKDYYCESGYGTDSNCQEGHCLMTETKVTCKYGCENDQCNPPPVTTTIPTTTIPPVTTVPSGTCSAICQSKGYSAGRCVYYFRCCYRSYCDVCIGNMGTDCQKNRYYRCGCII